MSVHWIGVDLGGTKILAGLFDDEFRCLARAKEATPPPNPDATGVFACIGQAVDRVLAESGVPAHEIHGLGMGVPGQLVPHKKRVRFAPNLGWRDVDLSAHLPATWKWPTFFENDVRVGIYGEWRRGSAQGAKHVLGIFAGTGVGGALILDGKLYHGFNFNAGEIGHTVVHWRKGTTLEQIAGRRSMMQRAAEQLGDSPKLERKRWKGIDPATVKSSHLAKLVDENDPLAVQLVDDAARALGAQIGSLINLLSPEVVVLGGGVAGALGENFRERVWEIACKHALPGATDGVRFVPALLEDDSGIVGAAALARDKATSP
jgi:glucokinase